MPRNFLFARLAQSVERKTLNLVVVGSSPTVGITIAKRLSLETKIITSLGGRAVKA